VGNTNKAAIYSNGGNRWNILGFNFTKRDALSSVYKISMIGAAVARLNESIAALNQRFIFPLPFAMKIIKINLWNQGIKIIVYLILPWASKKLCKWTFNLITRQV
jgi:hypothetical protein